MVPLNTFQMIVVPLLAAMAIATAIAAARRRVTPRVGALWVLLWTGSAIAVAEPDLIGRFADFAGIGRGADLVFYLFILCTFMAFFFVYLRFRRIDEHLTRIVRHLAIDDALRQRPSSEKREES